MPMKRGKADPRVMAVSIVSRMTPRTVAYSPQIGAAQEHVAPACSCGVCSLFCPLALCRPIYLRVPRKYPARAASAHRPAWSAIQSLGRGYQSFCVARSGVLGLFALNQPLCVGGIRSGLGQSARRFHCLLVVAEAHCHLPAVDRAAMQLYPRFCDDAPTLPSRSEEQSIGVGTRARYGEAPRCYIALRRHHPEALDVVIDLGECGREVAGCAVRNPSPREEELPC